MNAIEFFEYNPPSRDGAHQLGREQKRLRHSGSPIAFLAGRYITESKSNLMTAGAKYGSTLTPEVEDELTRAGIGDISGVVFGHAVRSMEDAVVEGTLDVAELISNINTSLMGTGVARFLILENVPHKRALEDTEREFLFDKLRRDKTFSFITEDMEVAESRRNMPPEITELFNSVAQFDLNPNRFQQISRKWRMLGEALINPLNHIPDEQDLLEDGFSQKQIITFNSLREQVAK